MYIHIVNCKLINHYGDDDDDDDYYYYSFISFF